MVISSIGTVIGNIIVFISIPFVWWLLSGRKYNQSFFKWLGLYRPELEVSKLWLIFFLLVYYINWRLDYMAFLDNRSLEALHFNTNVSPYFGGGLTAIIPAFIENFLANGLCEEAFFRGFLMKRLSNKFRFINAIIMQASLFAFMHNILFIFAGINISILGYAIMFLFIGFGAILLALLNERIYNGSIIPSIILHGLGNYITTIILAFSFL